VQELQHRQPEYSDEFHIVEFQMLLSKLIYLFIYVKSTVKASQSKQQDRGLKTKQKTSGQYLLPPRKTFAREPPLLAV